MTKRTITIAGVALLLMLFSSVTLTQARSSGAVPAGGGGFEISWYTIDGGAMFSTGRPYSLGGSIGQADAGTLSSGSYALNGGFWGDTSTQYRVYLPLILK